MKNIFRIISAILALVIVLATVACNNKPTDEPQKDTPTEDTNDVVEDILDLNPEIKNVILIIGDGMGLEHISAGQMYSGKHYNFTDWKYVSVNTDCVSGILTDSAAAGTAMATGELTARECVGMDIEGNELKTILDVAKERGKATGIVTTDVLSGGTPAAYSAHVMNRNMTQELILSQIESGVDLICGSYSYDCAKHRSKIESRGYTYCEDINMIGDTSKISRAYWQFSLATTSATVALKDAAMKAIDVLDNDEDGFVVMIEQAYIDIYSHWNQFDNTVRSVESLNDTVEAVMNWVGDRKDTAVIVTADHETGGLKVSGDRGVGGKTFNSLSGKPIYYAYTDREKEHTAAYVGMFVYGFDIDYSQFTCYSSNHLIKNTDIFKIMSMLVRNEHIDPNKANE